MNNQFISIMRPGPNIKSGQHDELIGKHCDYLEEYFAKKVVIFAGPSWEQNEDHFAIVVLETENKQEAQNIMNNNPAVAAGILTSYITEFEVFLERK
ncbi:YciI family protein [Candidatus Cloacimonadota bacterium]